MSRKPKSKLLPWLNGHEFKAVYELICQDNVEDKWRGVERLIAWILRTPKVPVAVVCTKELMKIDLEHQMTKDSDKDYNCFLMACTMAITRFVNLHTEEQQKRGKGVAVHKLAGEIGLPKWIVDIRHQGTHGTMPRVSILEAALRFCLDWLKRNFWEGHAREVKEDSEHGQRGVELDVKFPDLAKKILDDYMEYMGTNNAFQNGKPKHNLGELLKPLGKPLRTTAARTFLAKLLSQDGYLVPTTEQEKALRIAEADPAGGVPLSLRNFWLPCLTEMKAVGLGPALIVSAIIDQLASIDKHADSAPVDERVIKYLLSWAKELIQKEGIVSAADNWSPPEKRRKRASSQWRKTVTKCVEQPNKHSLHLLPCLMCTVQDPPLTSTKKAKLLDAVKLWVEGPNGYIPPANGRPSIEEMERLIADEMDIPASGGGAATPKGGKKHGSDESVEPWSYGKETIDWGRIPFGVLPWQPDDPDLLQLRSQPTNTRKRKGGGDAECV